MSYEFSLRAAGRVERYHALPTIQRQTTAEHSWQLLRIWLELYGYPDADVAIFILLHDAGELKTGDLPHTVKQENPIMRATISDIEQDHIKKMMLRNCPHAKVHGLPILSAWDRLRVKICDLLEAGEFAHDEVLLGNKEARQILFNVARSFRVILSPAQREHEHIRVAVDRLKTLLLESECGIVII